MAKAHTPHHSHTISTALLVLLLLRVATAHPDQTPLLNFKSVCTDPLNHLKSWAPATSPCSWAGVSCSNSTTSATPPRVTRLVLENLGLQAPSSALVHLSSLTQLRVLSLKSNLLWGPLPTLNLTGLKLLFLAHNNLSGPFPLPLLLSLPKLYRLDLSFNSFSGPLPLQKLNALSHLLTLRLEGNRFSGLLSVPATNLSSLQGFNVSSNQLTGPIPASLSGFPRSAFSLNTGLCGYPLQACKGSGSDPTRPGPAAATRAPTVSSSPSSLPMSTNYTDPKRPKRTREGGGGISTLSIVAIVLGDLLILGLVSVLLYCYFSKKGVGSKRGSKLMESTEKIVYSSSPYGGAQYGGGGQGERGRMVFFETGGENVKRFELEDLLRASAEMLGKGGFGTAYKAVLDDGAVVAVKRLKDGGGGTGRREFEQNMEVLGRLRHPNLVGLKAYYFARDEKLLVYDYIPNGSLFWLLHGNRGPGRTPLDWTTRLKIAAGAARGLAFIHSSCKALKLAHGNIKSTNILLDKSGNARVSDFGLALLASSAAKSNGYRAPELLSSDGKKATQKSDVYSFGVLLLEILTGKCPSVVDCGNGPGPGPGSGPGGVVDLPRWVQSVVREEWTAEVFDLELMRYKDIEEEMVGLLQVAMACTAAAPDQRPRMCHVVKMIEEIRGVDVSPCHDNNFDSVSDSPSFSEDTCGAASQ